MTRLLPVALLALTLAACQSNRSSMDDDMDMAPTVTADATVDAVQAAGGLTNLAPSAAVANIDAWIDRLDGNSAAAPVVSNLRLLRAELTSPTLNGANIGRILSDLGRQTTAAAGSDADLLMLGRTLSEAGDMLSAG
jgi:hypothetical protein